jgi:hypothetical protein
MIRLLKNLRRRSRFSLQSPGYARRAIGREILSAEERLRASITGGSTCAIRGFWNEPPQTEDIAACLRPAESQLQIQVSSAYLLLAWHKNGRAGLYSVDGGDSRDLPAGKARGWIVPAWLRPRGKLLRYPTGSFTGKDQWS